MNKIAHCLIQRVHLLIKLYSSCMTNMNNVRHAFQSYKKLSRNKLIQLNKLWMGNSKLGRFSNNYLKSYDKQMIIIENIYIKIS